MLCVSTKTLFPKYRGEENHIQSIFPKSRVEGSLESKLDFRVNVSISQTQWWNWQRNSLPTHAPYQSDIFCKLNLHKPVDVKRTETQGCCDLLN